MAAYQLTMEDKIAYKQMFDQVDDDHDGKIDYQQFVELFQHLKGLESGASLADIFQNADKDGNNKIDFEEFLRLVPEPPGVRDVYRQLFKEMDVTKEDKMLEVNEIWFALLKASKFVPRSQIEAMVAKVDANHDGKVSFEEFINMVPAFYAMKNN